MIPIVPVAPILSNQLSHRVAIVTGGGSGIGKGICLNLATTGATVVVADISINSANATVEEISEGGGSAKSLELDVSDHQSVVQAAEILRSLELSPDILVNNAGIFNLNRIEDISEELFDNMIAINLRGPFLMIRTFLPHMIDNSWGRIISISSTAGKTGEAFASHYCASKRGLIALSNSASIEAAPNVTVNCICPGFVNTPMTQTESTFRSNLESGVSEEEVVEQIRQQIPLGRIGHPTDIANAIIWLSLDSSNYITGQAINVDGGVDFH